MKKFFRLSMLVLFCIGVSKSYAQGLVFPFESTDAYLQRWILEESYAGHKGIDYACNEGTPVFAPISGLVTIAYDDEEIKSCVGFGNTWKLENPQYKVRGGHMLYRSIPFEVGDYVQAGQYIGMTSNSGYATNTALECLPDTGYHFHLEVEDVNGNILNPYDGHFIIDSDGSFRFPQEEMAGRFQDGSFSQAIKNCYSRLIKNVNIGAPYDDGAGPFVHNWLPFHYLIQNFINSKGEESAIMYDPTNGGQAYLVFGKFWKQYREGRNGRYGPDIPMDDGKSLGGPTADAENGIQYFEDGYFLRGSVELHRLDGALVEVFNPSGDTSSLTITGQAQSENHNTVSWYGGLLAAKYLVYRNGQYIGETTLFEFTEAGLTPGSVNTYVVDAVDSVGSIIDQSNAVTIISPGEVGSFIVQGVADGHTYIYVEWDNIGAPFYRLFVNGIEVTKTTFNRRTIGPLEPNTTYSIQVAATTVSDLVLEWSNVADVTTDQAPPPPPLAESVSDRIIINMPKTQWEFGETGYVAADVIDQFGNVMTGQRVLFIGSNSSVMPVSADSGYLLAHGLGIVEIWAELYDNRAIKSERVYVEVVEVVSETSSPTIYPSAPLMLFKKIEPAFEGPIVEGRAPMFKLGYFNPNDFSVSFRGPSIRLFSLDGQSLEFSSYSSILKTLQPGESWEGNVSGVYVLGPGTKYLQAQVRLEGSATDEWHLIDQGNDGVPTKTYIEVISENDLKADLRFNNIGVTSSEYFKGNTVMVRIYLINLGDVDVVQPFILTAGVAGRDSQSMEISGLNRGDLLKIEMYFSGLPAGNHKIDFWIDSDDVIPEYDEGNNMRSLIVEIQKTPGLVVVPQISDTTIVRDYNDSCGPYQDDKNSYLGIYTRKGIERFGRGLLNFDLSGLPSNIKIESAYIELYALGQGEYVGNDFHLNLLTEAFDPSFVDWCLRDSQNSWQNLGGAWSSFGQSSVFIPSFYTGGWHYQNGDINQWFTWDVTQMMQVVADEQLEFNGFILRQEDISNRLENQSVSFASMDHTDPNLRPRLVIQYSDAPPEPEQLPDLLVESIDFSSKKRGKNSIITADVWIKNNGTQDATAFSVEVKVVESGNIYTARFDSLQVGASISISFSERLKKVNSATIQVTVDTQNEVVESDESNNYVEDSYAL